MNLSGNPGLAEVGMEGVDQKLVNDLKTRLKAKDYIFRNAIPPYKDQVAKMFIGKEKFSAKSKMAMSLLKMSSDLKDAQEKKQW